MTIRNLLLTGVVLVFGQASYGQELPYLEDKYYEYNLDYSFQSKPQEENKYRADGMREIASTDVLPYVKMSFLFKDVPPDAYRVRVEDNQLNLLRNRKIKRGLKLILDLGFAADLKDGIAPNEYYIIIQDSDKKGISRIMIRFDKEGNFYLNEELYGKI